MLNYSVAELRKIKIIGYPGIFTLDFDLKDYDFSNYEYILFDEKYSNQLFNFYKTEMQQGEKTYSQNLGFGAIKSSGFFDTCTDKRRQSWRRFEEFCKIIIYEFSFEKDCLVLVPIRYTRNNELLKEEKVLRIN